MTVVKDAHFVVAPLAAWGHVRPILHLSLNLLTVHPTLHLTLLLAPSVYPRVQKELQSVSFAHIHSPSGSGAATPSNDSELAPVSVQKTVSNRLQVIACARAEASADFWTPEGQAREQAEYEELFPIGMKALLQGENTVNDKPNAFAGIIPSFVLFDLFQTFIVEAIVKLCEEIRKPVPYLLAFAPSNPSAMYHHYAPAELGGFVDAMKQHVDAHVAAGGDAMEGWAKYGFMSHGIVKHLPGLPPMYDYELHPLGDTLPLPPHIPLLISNSRAQAFHPAVTAHIIPTTSEVEPVAHKAYEDLINRPVLMAGIQFPESVWKGVKPARDAKSEDDERVFAFLDKMEKKHGKRSVIYVSLGSLFFPLTRPELVNYILESLHDAGMPFLFAYASDLAQIPDDFKATIAGWEDAEIVKFAPQWQVLDHDATGYFLSHCGSNSTAEAIMSRMPLVSMPFSADQGEFTALLTQRGVAIPLRQTYTFKNPDFKKCYDGTVIEGTEAAIKAEAKKTWDLIRGEKGEEMRAKMGELRDIMYNSWEGGVSRQTMLGIEKYF